MNDRESGALLPFEYRVFDKDGKIKFLRTIGRVVSNEDGKYFTGTVYDITDYVLIK